MEEPRDQPESLTAHAEELTVRREEQTVGSLRARKRVESGQVDEFVPRSVEDCVVERVSASEGDSGRVETLADGSISIPLLEEELVVTKRTIVRERVVIRKHVESRPERVTAELRRERIELDADPGVDVDVDQRG